MLDFCVKTSTSSILVRTFMKNVFPMLKVKRYCVNRFQVKLINYRKNNCEKRHSGGGGGIVLFWRFVKVLDVTNYDVDKYFLLPFVPLPPQLLALSSK